jgi:hypothetical protein
MTLHLSCRFTPQEVRALVSCDQHSSDRIHFAYLASNLTFHVSLSHSHTEPESSEPRSMTSRSFSRDVCAAAAEIGSHLYQWPSTDFPSAFDEETFVFGWPDSNRPPPMLTVVYRFHKKIGLLRLRRMRKVRCFSFFNSTSLSITAFSPRLACDL